MIGAPVSMDILIVPLRAGIVGGRVGTGLLRVATVLLRAATGRVHAAISEHERLLELGEDDRGRLERLLRLAESAERWGRAIEILACGPPSAA